MRVVSFRVQCVSGVTMLLSTPDTLRTGSRLWGLQVCAAAAPAAPARALVLARSDRFVRLFCANHSWNYPPAPTGTAHTDTRSLHT